MPLAPQPAGARLGALRGVTIVGPDLDGWAAAYGDYLGYTPDEAVAAIGPAQALAWDQPGIEGCPTITLYPASGARSFVRFIETAATAPGPPLTSIGWNAVELVVQQLDVLAASLASGPFRIIGPPAVLDLDFTKSIRAMQVVGPAGEVLYLTEIDGVIPGFDLPVAHSPADRIFVAVLGTSQLAAATQSYAGHTGIKPTPAIHAKVAVIAAAHNLSRETRFRLQTFALPAATLLEIDALPAATAVPPQITACGLPAGIAVMSFGDGDPRSFGPLVRGPDGELIEVLTMPVAGLAGIDA